MSKGFIALHRSIQDHWIFDDEAYLRAWMIMLMTVNHKENKSLIKGKLLVCPRGQSLMSHNSWAKKFGKKWNRNKVIRFFKLLESDEMIEQVNEQVTTRVTICNYSQYQDLKSVDRTGKRTGDDTPSEQEANRRRTGDDTQLNHGNHDNQKESGAEAHPPAKIIRFVKPNLDQVREYCQQKKLGMDCESFLDHYESNGWKVSGKTPMKDWRAAMRNWAKRDFGNKAKTGGLQW